MIVKCPWSIENSFDAYIDTVDVRKRITFSQGHYNIFYILTEWDHAANVQSTEPYADGGPNNQESP